MDCKPFELLAAAMNMNAKVQIQYQDYELNQWTVPQSITKELILRITHDGSVRKVKIEAEI